MTWGFSTGVVNGHAHITGDLITDLFSASTRGAVKRRNWLLEGLYDFVAYVRFGLYLRLLDRKSTRLNSSHSGESRMPSSA